MSFIGDIMSFRPGLHLSIKDRKHMVAKHVFQAFHVSLGIHTVIMIPSIHISKEIFAIDVLTALKPSLEHCRLHVLRCLRLYGDEVCDLQVIMVLGTSLLPLHLDRRI